MEETPKIDNQKALGLVASFGTKKFYHLVQSANHFGPKFLSTKQVSWVRSLLSLLGQILNAAGKVLQKKTPSPCGRPLQTSGTWAVPPGKSALDFSTVDWIWLGSLTYLTKVSNNFKEIFYFILRIMDLNFKIPL